ncbi:translation initiation factor 2 [Sporobacter termitidis]|uniref:translation initiation factor 2 n=1 Tax=Sporobacter termitidis TaxID=44749 RepID=UPI003BFA6DDA
MVKGVSRRVIVIKSPDRHLFEEAIFIVKEEALRGGGVTGDEIIKQAQEVADNYVRYHIKKRRLPRLPAPAFAAFGAAATALAWVLALYVL